MFAFLQHVPFRHKHVIFKCKTKYKDVPCHARALSHRTFASSHHEAKVQRTWRASNGRKPQRKVQNQTRQYEIFCLFFFFDVPLCPLIPDCQVYVFRMSMISTQRPSCSSLQRWLHVLISTNHYISKSLFWVLMSQLPFSVHLSQIVKSWYWLSQVSGFTPRNSRVKRPRHRPHFARRSVWDWKTGFLWYHTYFLVLIFINNSNSADT